MSINNKPSANRQEPSTSRQIWVARATRPSRSATRRPDLLPQPSAHLSFWQVGTSRCDVPARAVAGGTGMAGCAIETVRCAAERGADGAARRPYQKLRCAPQPIESAFDLELLADGHLTW
jgi:hypothetical protein